MSTTATHDLCIKTGEYTDRNGEQKGRWLTIGTVFRYDDGGSSIKLDCLPVGVPDWHGWVSVFKKKPREEQAPSADYQAPPQGGRYPNSAAPGQGHRPPSRAPAAPPADFDDDIPF
jgi:hypothetical protein